MEVSFETTLPPELAELDPNTLYVNASIDQALQPLVMWVHQGKMGTIGLTLARERARQLFEAAASAHSERLVFDVLRKLDKSSHRTGFGLHAQQVFSPLYGKVLQAVRQRRPTGDAGIEVIFGARSQEPIVNVHWYGEMRQLDIETARAHASDLLLAAEAAESDGFFYDWFQQKLDIPPEQTYGLIQEFQEYRRRRRFEELFHA